MTSLSELRGLIDANMNVRSQIASNQLLFTIGLTNGRKQTVLVTIRNLKDGQVIEVTSRCGVVRGPSIIRASLTRNMNSELGGIALDTSTTPKTLDCVHRVVIPKGHGVNIPELLGAIASVGVQADVIEGKLGHDDNF